MENQTVIIDVRESEEFRNERVSGSLHLPLSQLDLVAPGVLSQLRHCSMVILCRSGGRASLAYDRLKSLGLIDPSKCTVFAGGILEWKKQGRKTEGSGASVLPIMRQVQLIAGGFVFFGGILSVLVHSAWVYVPIVVGAGLMVAGLTGFCGMALLLAKLPWNQTRSS